MAGKAENNWPNHKSRMGYSEFHRCIFDTIIALLFCFLVWRDDSYFVFTLELKRKPLFYIFNLIIPSLVVTLICILGLFAPSSSGGGRTEKVTLGITTILALSIILLVIGDQIPRTSTVIPRIGKSVEPLFLVFIVFI